jgi:hypothetical protein
MATYFTINPSSLSGSVYSTTFEYALKFDYDYITWNLGDGTFVYNEFAVSHTYDYPGTYQVSLTAGKYYDDPLLLGGPPQLITETVTVYANYVYRDAIIFKEVPSTNFSYAGRETDTPFVLSLTSSKIDEQISVCLYASNSQSVPYFSATDKWNFLAPRWRFIDASTKKVLGENVVVDTVPLYKDSTVVGVSGYLAFYYIDDTPSNIANPLQLKVTLNTENFLYPPESKYADYKSYSNPQNPQATLSWTVSATPVTNYKITENYLNDIYPIKWANVPIPVLITCLHIPTDPNQEPSDVISYPSTNAVGMASPVTLTLYGNNSVIPTSLYTVESPLYFKATDESNIRSSGYIFTTITPLTSFAYDVKIAATSNLTNVVDYSTPFKIHNIEEYQIAKVNETFNYAKYLKDLTLPEHLNGNNIFFDEFLPCLVGDNSLDVEGAGRVLYERIANFVQAHSDYETSEIPQLMSIAESLAYKTKTFGKDFPATVMRLLNLFSVPKQKLRGKEAYSTNFEDNLKEIMTQTTMVSTGEIIIAKDIRYGTYQSIFVSPVGSLQVYPLAMIELPQMRSPLFTNYYFFKYKEEAIGHRDNIIDWKSPYTTIDYSLSSYDDWYGNEGLLDIAFNNLLTKHLFLE